MSSVHDNKRMKYLQYPSLRVSKIVTHRKAWSNSMGWDTNEPSKHSAGWKASDGKGHTFYDSVCMTVKIDKSTKKEKPLSSTVHVACARPWVPSPALRLDRQRKIRSCRLGGKVGSLSKISITERGPVVHVTPTIDPQYYKMKRLGR